jgi:hypothetical protein
MFLQLNSGKSIKNTGNPIKKHRWMKILERKHIKKEEKYIKGVP